MLVVVTSLALLVVVGGCRRTGGRVVGDGCIIDAGHHCRLGSGGHVIQVVATVAVDAGGGGHRHCRSWWWWVTCGGGQHGGCHHRIGGGGWWWWWL